MMNFARNFTALRKKMGISQEQMAERCGVSRAALAKWETGNTTPNVYMIIEIAKIFDVSVDELLKGKMEISTDNSIEGVYTKLQELGESQKRILAAVEKNKTTGTICERYNHNLQERIRGAALWQDDVMIDAIFSMGLEEASKGNYGEAINYLEEALSHGEIQAVDALISIHNDMLEIYGYEEDESHYFSYRLEFAQKLQQYGKIMEEEIRNGHLY